MVRVVPRQASSVRISWELVRNVFSAFGVRHFRMGSSKLWFPTPFG